MGRPPGAEGATFSQRPLGRNLGCVCADQQGCDGARMRRSTTAAGKNRANAGVPQAQGSVLVMAHPDDCRRRMTTFETGQQPYVRACVEPAPLPYLSIPAIVLFFASLSLLIGASLSLGFLLGRASSWGVPVGTAPTSVAEQLSAVSVAKTVPQIELSRLNEGALATTVDLLPSTTPVSQVLAPNVGAASDPTVHAPSRYAQHWLKLAEEVRLQAEESTQANGKRLLLKIAETYERLAQLTTIKCRVDLASCRRWIALEEQRARLSRHAPR